MSFMRTGSWIDIGNVIKKTKQNLEITVSQPITSHIPFGWRVSLCLTSITTTLCPLGMKEFMVLSSKVLSPYKTKVYRIQKFFSPIIYRTT